MRLRRPGSRPAGAAVLAGVLLSLVLAGCGGTTHPVDPHVVLDPVDSSMDAPLRIRLTGVGAAGTATLQVTSTDGAGTAWTSSATYVADAAGSVDVTTAAATAGTYTGVAAMGPIASMEPATGPAAYRWPRDPATFTATVRAQGRNASTSLTRTLVRPGDGIEYSQPTVGSDGFAGFYATTTAEKASRHPAVLLLGGSEGGNDQQVTAAALTLHGMSALSVAYFDAPGLPQTLRRIPLEYVAKALAWLRRQPGVDPTRVWVMGTSRGSEAALLLGVDYPGLVHGVIASSPSSVVNCSYPTGSPPCDGAAWTFRGQPVPYSTDFGDPTPSDNPAAVIPVERIRGPVLAVCGGADQVWRSCPMADAILSRRRAHDVGGSDRLYRYPDAGHGVGNLLPDQPMTPIARLGGTSPASDDQALQDVWPRVVAVLNAP